MVAAVKQHTTKDVYGGIMNAVDAVLEDAGVHAALINQGHVGHHAVHKCDCRA